MVAALPPQPMLPGPVGPMGALSPAPAALAVAPPMPPPMPAPSPMDPLSAAPGMLADPTTMLTLLLLLAGDDERDHGPRYPAWYRPEDCPKPDAALVQAKATRDKSLYDRLVRRMGRDRLIFLMLSVGRFRDFDEDAEITFADASVAQDAALVINLIAGTDTNFEARARRLDEAEIAEKKEQAAHLFREQNIDRHARAFGTSLKYDEAATAVKTGHLCARLSLDYYAERDQFPVRCELLDPATCYPTWDGERGMRTMTRAYTQTVEEIVAAHDTPERTLAAKLLDPLKKVRGKDGIERTRTLADTVEALEYWDRRWYSLVVDGEEVATEEHKYGCVPFVYLRSPFGDSGISTLAGLVGPGGTIGTAANDAGDALAMKGLSHIWATIKTHTQREAIMGRLFTELKKTANPNRTFEQTADRYGETPDVTNAEGGISLLLAGAEKEVHNPPDPRYQMIAPLMGVLNEGVQRSLMPASAYGLTQNANESGYAIEGLNESGRDKLTPWLTMLEEFDRQTTEMALKLYRDWGYLLGTDGERGEVDVLRRRPIPGQPTVLTLTPEELRQVGVKIRSKRTSIRISNLGKIANDLAMLKANGWLEDVDAMEKLGVQDPLAALQRIEIQEFEKSDIYKNIRLVKWLEEQGKYDEAAMARQMVTAQGAPGAAQGGSPMGGGQPGMPGAPGAPPGVPMGPQGAQSPLGAMGMPSRLAGPVPQMVGPPPGSLA